MVPRAKFPLIKLSCTEKYWLRKIDLSVQDSRHQGTNCVSLVQALLKKYPVLSKMVFFFKQILFLAKLNDPYFGGLSSYGLTLLLVFWLQQIEINLKIDITQESNSGTLIYFVMMYLAYYSQNYYVIITPPEEFQMMAPVPKPMGCLESMFIVDPLSPSNNVAKSAYNFHKIKFLMSVMYQTLHANLSSSHWKFWECSTRASRSPREKKNIAEILPKLFTLASSFNCAENFGYN